MAAEPLVSAYVCRAVANCPADGIVSVVRLASGENNALYAVTYRGRDRSVNQVLVRLGPRDTTGRVRAEREAAVLDRVGGVAGPRLYDFSADDPELGRPVMCLECLRGDQPDLHEAVPEKLERLGKLVGWLHAQPAGDLGLDVSADVSLSASVRERWGDHVEARLGAIRDPLPVPLQERLGAAVVTAARAVKELEDSAAQLVLLHGDISGANMLWTPEPVLIDWEYTRLGDPADEIAYLFTQNALDERRRDAFWRGYSEGLADHEIRDIARRVRHWEPITLVGSVLWWLDAWSRAGRNPYYLEQAVTRLGRS